MRQVTESEYQAILTIFNKEMKAVALHEKKNSWFGIVHRNNCIVRSLSDDIILFQMYTPAFISFIRDVYPRALLRHPEHFGTRNAKDIIHALYLESNAKDWNEDRYADFLSNEVFCLLLCKQNNEYCTDVLRIDLFRKLDESKELEGAFEFTGGLFHALKHFSIEEQSASILPNQNVKLFDVEQLVWPIAHAFYRGTWVNGNRNNTYESSIVYLGKNFTLEFYKEPGMNVSFVNSVIPKTT